MRDRADASYSILMEPRIPPGRQDPLCAARGLLEFKPWMLALAVFLACAIGITVMEQFRDGGAMWAQVTAREAHPAR